MLGSKTPAYIPADDKSKALLTTNTLHWRVHSGHVFDFSSKFSIPPGAVVAFSGVVGDNNVHWNNYAFKASDGPIDVELFRSPTVSSEGSSQEAVNRNDESILTPTMQIYNHASTSITTPGERMFITGILADAAAGFFNAGVSAADEQREEWILAANTRYLLRLTNSGSTATVYAGFMWYEERTDSTSSSTYST